MISDTEPLGVGRTMEHSFLRLGNILAEIAKNDPGQEVDSAGGSAIPADRTNATS